jgi:hypothetical protein
MKPHHVLDEDAWIDRIKRQLPRSRDPVLVVLKCHLLLEETMDRLIAAPLQKPAILDKARLTFSQKIHLAAAVTGAFLDRNWRFLERFNSLRNKLAHRLDGYNLDQELNHLLMAYDPHEFDGEKPEGIPLQKRLTYLKRMVLITCGFLSGVAIGIRGRLSVIARQDIPPPRMT